MVHHYKIQRLQKIQRNLNQKIQTSARVTRRFVSNTIKTLSMELRASKEIVTTGAKNGVLRDPIMSVPLSSKVLEKQILEEAIPLNEYKFDHSRLVVIK